MFGNSFGGFVAMHYAARHPDHPAVVLSSTRLPSPPASRPPASRRSAAPRSRPRYERIYVDGELIPEAWADYMVKCLPLCNLVHPRRFGDAARG